MNLKKLLVSVIVLGALASACAPVVNAPAEPADPTAPSSATGAPAFDQQYPEAWSAWQSGPHAAGYDLGKGPNTYCARCHSPRNWDPAASVDPPPNCVSCKFPSDAQPRLAKSNPLIPESEWKGVGCDACHKVDQNSLETEISWLDNRTGFHETLASPTELCERCHKDTETLRHSRALSGEIHQGYACTDCHEPHSLQASCASADCHASVSPETCPGFDADHQSVSCTACHDASGAEVGPLEDGSRWVTFRTVEVLGRGQRKDFQSHHIQLQVDCARCHFPSNPWELADQIEGSKAP